MRDQQDNGGLLKTWTLFYGSQENIIAVVQAETAHDAISKAPEPYSRWLSAVRAEEGDLRRGYIEIVGAIGLWRYDLTDSELRAIGRFTRGNITMWFDSHTDPTWVGILPIQDFHAVCGDINIPWATKEGFDTYERVKKLPGVSGL